MDDLIQAFAKQNLPVPARLLKLIDESPNRKTIYKRLWAAAKFGACLGGNCNTFTFPKELRQAVREKFPDDPQGKYDDQYTEKPGVYHVTMCNLAKMPYP